MKLYKDVPIWEKRQHHYEEVRRILIQEKCMDQKGQLRAWHKDTHIKLEDKGHTNLDFDQCQCKL